MRKSNGISWKPRSFRCLDGLIANGFDADGEGGMESFIARVAHKNLLKVLDVTSLESLSASGDMV